MNAMNIDLSTATLEDLDTLSIDDLLGQNIADVDLSNALPDGLFIGVVEDYELKKYAAKPEENKKASAAVSVKVKVLQAQTIKDPSIDPATLTNRTHFQSFFVTTEFGKAQLVKFLLGVIGVKYTDKAAIMEVGRTLSSLLEELKVNGVPFGFTIANTERKGRENSDIVFKEPAFIEMNKAHELLG